MVCRERFSSCSACKIVFSHERQKYKQTTGRITVVERSELLKRRAYGYQGEAASSVPFRPRRVVRAIDILTSSISSRVNFFNWKEQKNVHDR